MNSHNPDLITYIDFDASYIAGLAQRRGFIYSDILSTDHIEQGLYNNQKTNTVKQHALQMVVDGLECEYYTAAFTPVIMASNAMMRALEANVSRNTQTQFQVQIFSIKLPYSVENVYVESRTNITLNNIMGMSSVVFKDSENVTLEGDFNTFFRVYVPKGEAVNAFTILAPNIMVRLLQDAGDYDFEFAGDRVYFYQTFSGTVQNQVPFKQKNYDGLLEFGIDSAKTMARASRPAQTTDPQNTPMWQLYGTSNFKLLFAIISVVASFLFIAICIVIPLLWPVLIVLLSIFGARYMGLRKKRKRLLANWGRDENGLANQ